MRAGSAATGDRGARQTGTRSAVTALFLLLLVGSHPLLAAVGWNRDAVRTVAGAQPATVTRNASEHWQVGRGNVDMPVAFARVQPRPSGLLVMTGGLPPVRGPDHS